MTFCMAWIIWIWMDMDDAACNKFPWGLLQFVHASSSIFSRGILGRRVLHLRGCKVREEPRNGLEPPRDQHSHCQHQHQNFHHHENEKMMTIMMVMINIIINRSIKSIRIKSIQPTNQPTNSTNQSINQSINSNNQSINQSIKSTRLESTQLNSINQSNPIQSINKSFNQFDQSIKQIKK
jgi:hypothetical protein